MSLILNRQQKNKLTYTNSLKVMQMHALKFFQIYAYIVGFNAISREEVRTGFKNKIELKEAMTGEEFCHLIDLDYQIIREKRAQDRVDNMTVFVEELLNITELRSALISRINSE